MIHFTLALVELAQLLLAAIAWAALPFLVLAAGLVGAAVGAAALVRRRRGRR